MLEITNLSWILVQLLLAFIIILILYIATLIILRIDSIVIFPSFTVKQREETIIQSERANSGNLPSYRFNTIFPFRKDFVKIPQSVNGTTGSQFTYQFWMKVTDSDPTNFDNLVLLLKGDSRLYNIGYFDMQTNKRLVDLDEGPDYMIKSPLIRFKGGYKNLVVELNTNNHPNVKLNINLDGSDDCRNITSPTSNGDTVTTTVCDNRKNLLTLLPLDWFLFTFVFEENYSITQSTENGIKFTLYINDLPIYTASGSTNTQLRNNFIKQNDGDLHLLPNLPGKINVLELSDVKYYNYAKTDVEVRTDYNKRAKTFSENSKSQNLYTSLT